MGPRRSHRQRVTSDQSAGCSGRTRSSDLRRPDTVDRRSQAVGPCPFCPIDIPSRRSSIRPMENPEPRPVLRGNQPGTVSPNSAVLAGPLLATSTHPVPHSAGLDKERDRRSSGAVATGGRQAIPAAPGGA